MGLFKWLVRRLKRARQPPQPRVRQYAVHVFDQPIGTFALPMGDHLVNPNSFVRPLLTRPFRVDFLDSFIYFWVEPDANNTFRTVTWHPETPELQTEGERFFQTAHEVPTDGAADHSRTEVEARLIQEALADPTGDAPYREYARRLTSRHDSFGEYIRLTLEIESLPESDPKREQLETRRAMLVREDGPRWVLPLTDLGLFPGDPSADDGFTPDAWYGPRGVIEELTVGPEARVLPGNLSRLFRAAPFLRKLSITSAFATVADVGTEPAMAQIESLELRLADGTADDFQRFAESPYLRGLRELTLRNCGFGPVAAEHLARAVWFAGLRKIDLSGNAMGDSGADALAASPFVANLTTVELAGNDLTDRGLVALGTSPHLAHLTEFHVAGGSYGEAGAASVSGSAFAPALRSLDMRFSGLDANAARALSPARFPALKALALSSNPLGAEGLGALIATEWFAHLERFFGGNCGLGDAGARALSDIAVTSLKVMDLGGNEITDAGVIALARSQALANLTRLSLGNNPFGLPGVKALAEVNLPALEELDVSGIDLGRAGAQALAASPHLAKLKRLTVSAESVGIIGRSALIARFTERVVSCV
jgi:hypothetical protein